MCTVLDVLYLVSPPGNDSFQEGLCFAGIYYFFLFFPSCNLRALWADRREILHDPQTCIQFYNPGPKFWGSLPKIFRDQKHAKFGPISVDFKLWQQISPERMKIFKIGELIDQQQFLPH